MRQFGPDRGVAAGDGLVRVVHRDVGAQLVVVRPGGSAVVGQAQLLGFVQVHVHVQAREDQGAVGLRRDQSRHAADGREGDAAVVEMLDAHAANRRTPIPLDRAHGVAREDLFPDIVVVARNRDEGVGPPRRVRRRLHLVCIEVAEGVVHGNPAEEGLVQGKGVVVGGNPDRGELGRRVEDDPLFVSDLGPLVELQASPECRISTQEGRLLGHPRPTGIGGGGIDGVQDRQGAQRLGEGVDGGHRRPGLVAGGAGELQGR